MYWAGWIDAMSGSLSYTMTFTSSASFTRVMRLLFYLLMCLTVASPAMAGNARLGFSFDCDNTPDKPCRKLVASDRDRPIMIESSSAAWSDRYKKVIVVSDNYNDLV